MVIILSSEYLFKWVGYNWVKVNIPSSPLAVCVQRTGEPLRKGGFPYFILPRPLWERTEVRVITLEKSGSGIFISQSQ